MCRSTRITISYLRSTMLKEKITFDRFVRGMLIVAAVVLAYFLLKMLSSVLWPFFVAWLIAYLLYPILTFLEKKCHLKFRIVSILVTLVVIIGIIATVLVLTLPKAVEQCKLLSDDMMQYATTYLAETDIPNQLQLLAKQNLDQQKIISLLQNDDVMEAARAIGMQTWNLLSGTVGVLMGLVDFLLMLLYLFFILLDYEKINEGWAHLIPNEIRGRAVNVMSDVKNGMNAYFRGQALISLIVGILFSIGFTIIGMPMAIGLGMLIGLLNMIPYMHTLGLIPTVILALLKASHSGEGFWTIMLCALAVFAVVQCILDMILTPKIMGKAMGLKPAVILLSLSVWGALLGIIGLIIALPMTTLCWSYYKRYVLHEEEVR